MIQFVNIAILVLSTILVIFILLQSKGGGLSTVFGGEGNVYQTRRGLEKGIFVATAITAVLFVALCVYSLFLQK